MRFLVTMLSALVLLSVCKAAETEHQKPASVAGGAMEPVADLQRRIDAGQIKLEFNTTHGYLKSLLENLAISISSQVLVFSRSNFQLDLVSPQRPRALYFKDDVYVGWVRGGSDVEIASIDPKRGPVFYTLSQQARSQPKFVRQTSNCLVCHDSSQTVDPIPRVLMLSVLPDSQGTALKAAALVTNDKSPLRERWGGWYVTGTHGDQRHLGNTIVQASASAIGEMKDYIAKMNLDAGANVTDLSGRLDDTPYLSRHSDIVALMVLGHQTHLQNLIALGVHEVEASNTPDVVKSSGERIVKTMLFVEEAPLAAPIQGTSSFAEDFIRLGPRDRQGRSLREFDLKRRLFRYPLSYLIYSQAFDQMPSPLKDYVSARIREVLGGTDKSSDFKHLSETDRTAILEILKETGPGWAGIR